MWLVFFKRFFTFLSLKIIIKLKKKQIQLNKSLKTPCKQPKRSWLNDERNIISILISFCVIFDSIFENLNIICNFKLP